MNDLLKTLTDQLKGAGGGSKAIAALVGLAVIVAIGFAAVVSNRPDLQPTMIGLDGRDTTNVCKALAEAGIAFETSQGNPPYTIFVDEDDRSAAFRAAYASGALDKPLEGVQVTDGPGAIFMSRDERRQVVNAKACQDVEMMLEYYDFVLDASVLTSLHASSPISRLRGPQPSASVTMRVTGGRLNKAQGDLVAKIVSRALGVEEEHLVVSDHEGNCLFDGSDLDEMDMGSGIEELFTFQKEYDERLTTEVNSVLTEVLGPGKSRVIISSRWGFDQSLTVTNTTAKGATLNESKVKTETPISERGGSPAGFSANIPDPPSGATPGPTTPTPVATSEETSSQYAPSSTREQRVDQSPTLKHLSVALYVDATVDATQFVKLQEQVQASVQYDKGRGDTFSAQQIAFYVPEVTDDPAAADGEEAAEPGSNRMMEILMRRGVEIVTAIVFIFLLLKSLKGAKAAKPAPRPRALGAVGGDGDEIDPELLARAQVEELLRADPDRVGEILSEWAREEQKTSGAA